jgi:hypothetical protein
MSSTSHGGSDLGSTAGQVTSGPSGSGPASLPTGPADSATDDLAAGQATGPAGVITASPVAPVSVDAPVSVAVAGTSATGTLTVSPTTVLLAPLHGGSLKLTASGGPVGWSLSVPATLLGSVSVTPSSGTLNAGDSVTVAISTTGLLSLDTQLTVEPGGQLVTVVLGVA